jgi:hypothetical protein
VIEVVSDAPSAVSVAEAISVWDHGDWPSATNPRKQSDHIPGEGVV